MIYKSKHVVDLETGVIVDADVRPGDEHDMADLTETVLEVEARINEVMEADKETEHMELVAADKGYFKLEEVYLLRGVGIEAAIGYPPRRRWTDRLREEDGKALEAAQAVVTSESGRGWMPKRSEHVGRVFHHFLDHGGVRRSTLRGRESVRKLYLIRSACANLSLLMRHLVKVGTPRQALAGSQGLSFRRCSGRSGHLQPPWTHWTRPATPNQPALDRPRPISGRSSAGQNDVVQRAARQDSHGPRRRW